MANGIGHSHPATDWSAPPAGKGAVVVVVVVVAATAIRDWWLHKSGPKSITRKVTRPMTDESQMRMMMKPNRLTVTSPLHCVKLVFFLYCQLFHNNRKRGLLTFKINFRSNLLWRFVVFSLSLESISEYNMHMIRFTFYVIYERIHSSDYQ